MSQEYKIINQTTITNGGITETDVSYVSTTASTVDFSGLTVGSITATSISVSGSSAINTNDNRLYSQNILNVKKNPGEGEFLTFESALNYITGNSISNRYIINGGVGEFLENQLNMKPYVSIVGSSIQETIIKPIGSHNLFVFTDVMSELSFMSLQSVPIGYSAVFCNDSGDYTQLHKINFVDCDTNVKLVATTKDTVIYMEYCDVNGIMTYGTHQDGSYGFRAVINTENWYTFPTTTGFTANFATGPLSILVAGTAGIYGSPIIGDTPTLGNFGIVCQNGAEISCNGVNIGGFQVGLQNNNVGTGCTIDILSVMFDDNIDDIIIDSPFTRGSFLGAASLDKITVDPLSIFTTTFNQPESDSSGVVISGNIYNGAQVGDICEITTLINNQTLGLIEGGLSDGGGFQVNVSSGLGYLLNGDVLKKIVWSATSITLSANETKYIYFNQSGVLSTSNSSPIILQNVLLGRVNTNSTHIQFIDDTAYRGDHTTNRITEVFREVFGSLFSYGCVFSKNATPLKVDVTGGEYYFGANEFLPSGGTAVTFDKYYRHPSSGWTITDSTDIIPNDKYDDGSGVLQNLTAGYFAKGLMYLIGDGANQKWFYLYPQSEYSTSGATETASIPTAPSYFNDSVVPVASFIVQQGNSNIVEIISERPLPVTQISSSSPTSSHLALTDLLTNNAGHSQFYMLNGSTPLAANLNLNSYSIISGSTFNGVTIQTHASRHLPNGADPLTTTVPVNISYTNTEGIANSFSRSDHVHGHGNLSGGTLHTTASTSNHGFMSSVDKTYFDTVPGLFNTKAGLSGATFTGVIYTPSVSATTISATTYYGLPTDISVTGGTYTNPTGTATFTNNTGGTFNVSGFFTGATAATSGQTNDGTSNTLFVSPIGLENSKYSTVYGDKTYMTASGTNSYSGSATPAITALTSGCVVTVKFTNANTNTGCTFTLNGLTTKSLVKGLSSTSLVSGDILDNGIYTLLYDGAVWVIIDSIGILRSLDWSDFPARVSSTVGTAAAISLSTNTRIIRTITRSSNVNQQTTYYWMFYLPADFISFPTNAFKVESARNSATSTMVITFGCAGVVDSTMNGLSVIATSTSDVFETKFATPGSTYKAGDLIMAVLDWTAITTNGNLTRLGMSGLNYIGR